jgi:hypothetical protein
MTTTSQLVRPVTDDEVRSFREDGWVRLEGFVDRSVVGRMLEVAKGILGEDGTRQAYRPGVDVGFSWWNDYNRLALESIEPFNRVSLSQQIGLNAQRFIGRDVPVRFFSDQIGVKQPAAAGSKNAPTPVHQDYPYGHWDRVGNVVFWVALEDMEPERGVVRFYSGSQKEGPLGSRTPGSDEAIDLLALYPWLEERYLLSPPVGLKAGDATCHGPLVVHRAPQNTTNSPRWQYVTQYFPADAQWTGAELPAGGNRGRLKEPGQLFDHPDWPVVYP